MSNNRNSTDPVDIRPQRLTREQIDANFADMHPPLTPSEAIIDADRCYFCYAAPCQVACPTGIDIPGFIQKIRSGNIKGSARTILSENIMGGMCARVCPTEVLCEQACVRNTHEDRPVRIGLLQRYATDPILAGRIPLFERGPASGRTVAIAGGGPAGLSCAHRLAMLGHQSVVFEPQEKIGGLNEYGIAAYKTPDDFAAREVEYILGIGGIEIRPGALGRDLRLEDLRRQYDAVFLGFGLAGVNGLGLDNERLEGVANAVDYIATLRQAPDKTSLPVGRRIVVIGGGMTAIDIAVQSKALGAEEVTIVYRRGQDDMNASRYEQEFAQIRGVNVRCWARPSALRVENGRVRGVEFEATRMNTAGRLEGTGESFVVESDMVFKAIGQKVVWEGLGDTARILELEQDRIRVDDERRTSLAGVWAGGDCVYGGEDLTVSAVQDGKVAAISIDRYLRSGAPTRVPGRGA
jgi:dihydropyrimidine dehydrogenase (NAD+) subunit PreT